MSIIILQASARPNGNTHQVANYLARKPDAIHLDLLEYQIHPFRYEQRMP